MMSAFRIIVAMFATMMAPAHGVAQTERSPQKAGLEFHVAMHGNDANRGTASEPFATIERARDAIRDARKGGALPPGGVTVFVHDGIYELPKTLEFTATDSGTASSPVVYRSVDGGSVRISGGRIIARWVPVTDEIVLARLDPLARDHVVQADLRAMGVHDLGEIGLGVGDSAGPGMELYFEGRPMMLARYPNEGYLTIADVEGPTEIVWNGVSGRAEPVLVYQDDRPSRWIREKDGWVHGFWFHDWADERHRIASIDHDSRRMILKEPYHHYGYRKGQWFYAFNLLSEIDQPGEWYLDRSSGMAYFWPPDARPPIEATVSVRDSLISMSNTAYVTFSGLSLEAVRGTAVTAKSVNHVRVENCTFRNIGGTAASISGTDSGLTACEISLTGRGGIRLEGGVRSTLEPAGLYASHNHIHHWSRWKRTHGPAIEIAGVGIRVSHNHLHDGPHTAVLFSGNEHMIEYNDIHDVCTESNDAGAIYAGRDLTMRGTTIRHNFLHEIRGLEGRGCVGVYLDDMYSGTFIYGNIFKDVTNAAFIGGGHDNRIENNIFINCAPAIHIDSRGLGWARHLPDAWRLQIAERGTLSGIRINRPPFSERYPALATITQNPLGAPIGNVIVRNIQWGGRWSDIDETAQGLTNFQDNLLDTDPRFMDAEAGQFELRDDSPAHDLGFQRIPVEMIGVQEGLEHASAN